MLCLIIVLEFELCIPLFGVHMLHVDRHAGEDDIHHPIDKKEGKNSFQDAYDKKLSPNKLT